MTTPSSSRSARWAHGVVVDWTLTVTRGLPVGLAHDRFQEIVSDLWEQGAAADRHGGSGLRLAADILIRAAFGVPADLSWRLAVLADRPRGRVAPPAVPAKAWVPLGPGTPFDQTNGAFTFVEDGPQHTGRNAERDMLELGVAANAAAGFGFGGMGG